MFVARYIYIINVISTVGDGGVSDVRIRSKQGIRSVCKPNGQVMYNKKYGKGEKFDKFCSKYPYGRISRKWYQRIWHFIVEAVLVNSCIPIICITHPTPNSCSQRVFREKSLDLYATIKS